METDNETAIKLFLGNGAAVKNNIAFRAPLLRFAVTRSNSDLMKFMLEVGLDINKRDEYGNTALHCAIFHNNFCQVQFLIGHGADVTLPNNAGTTPLHYPCGHPLDNSLNICELLLGNNADCNARDEHGRTPLHDAVRSRRLKLAELLLDHGADVSAADHDGFTALHFVYADTKVHLVELLLDHGSDIYSQTNRGSTALHEAVYHANVEVTEMLLRRGAMVDKKCKRGSTPLAWAVGGGCCKCVQLLFEYGANLFEKTAPYPRDIHNDSPSMISILRYAAGHLEMSALILQQLVKMEHLNFNIEVDDWQLIVSDYYLNEHYQVCTLELQRMKDTILYENISLFNLLMGSEKIISKYVGDKKLARALYKEYYARDFPIYYVSLKKVFDAKVKACRLQNRAVEVLNEIL